MKGTAVALILSVWPLSALGDAADIAREAAEDLRAAAAELTEGGDSIGHLTEIVRSFETGLAAMREGLREVASEERQTSARLRERSGELAALTALIAATEKRPEARFVLHPDGPLASVRAAMLGAELFPKIEERRALIAQDAARIKELRTAREEGVAELTTALSRVKTARTDLASATRARRSPSASLSTDAAALEALLNSSETLAAFADSLIPDRPAERSFNNAYSLPVTGKRVGAFGTEGLPGWTFETSGGALLTSPADATVRFAGTMPEQGEVLILETQPGRLVILTGLGESLVSRGQIVAEREPIGFMPGSLGGEQENLIETEPEDGQLFSERLYMEVRQGQAPVDPSTLFRTGEQ